MKIFLIYGEIDAGKTTTCQKILDRLNAHGWSQLSFAKIENPADGWFNDFKTKGLFNNQTIAIYSPGDDCGHLRAALKFAHENPTCDILVATVRKGIHYNSPLQPFYSSSQHTVTWFTLNKGMTIPEKNQLENKLAMQISALF